MSTTSKEAAKKFVATKREFLSVPEGQHKATIIEVDETFGKKWGTPQVMVKFETDHGSIINWFNLMGYEHDDSGEYVLGKDGKPVLSEENTEAAERIFTDFAGDCGLEDFNIEDLQGQVCGIVVGISEFNGKKGVTRTMPIDQVVEEAVEADGFGN